MASSPESQQQRSVFISYSRQDTAVALRVKAALAAQGIHVWVDQAEIMPGTPDWEEALRHAIKQSQALILIASSNSRQSHYVKDELDLARSYQHPVYPLWVLGEVWMEAIPLGWGHTQFIDARGASEQKALQTLTETLSHLLNPAPTQEQSKQRVPSDPPLTLYSGHSPPTRDASTPLGTTITLLEGHTNMVWSVDWSPDGKRLASASYDQTVRIWDIASGKSLLTLEGHTARVDGVAWSLDGQRLASASGDKTVRLWNAATGESIATLKGHTASVHSVAWSPDGKRLASAGADKTVQLWDVNGKPLTALTGHIGSIRGVAWSPDGKRLASACGDKTVRLWDAESGKLLVTLGGFLNGHKAYVFTVAWSPYGQQLASASQDKTIQLWDVTGKHVATLKGHEDSVWGVAWSPDGQRLASTSMDKTVRIWDSAAAKQIATLKGHTAGVRGITWSPDGKHLASASEDRTVRIWKV